MPAAFLSQRNEDRHLPIGEERVWKKDSSFFKTAELLVTLLILLFGACSVWRGFWVALDVYLFQNNTELSIWVTGLIGFVCTFLGMAIIKPLHNLNLYTKKLEYQKLSKFSELRTTLKKPNKKNHKDSSSYKIPMQIPLKIENQSGNQGYSHPSESGGQIEHDETPELLIRKNSLKLTENEETFSSPEKSSKRSVEHSESKEEEFSFKRDGNTVLKFLTYNLFVASIKATAFIAGRLFILFSCFVGLCFWRAIWCAWDYYTSKSGFFLGVSCIVGILVLLPFNNLSAVSSCPNPVAEDDFQIDQYFGMYANADQLIPAMDELKIPQINENINNNDKKNEEIEQELEEIPEERREEVEEIEQEKADFVENNEETSVKFVENDGNEENDEKEEKSNQSEDEESVIQSHAAVVHNERVPSIVVIKSGIT